MGFVRSVRDAAAVTLCVGLCAQPMVALAADEAEVHELKQEIEELKLQNRELSRRLSVLENETSGRKSAAPHARSAAPARTAQHAAPPPAGTVAESQPPPVPPANPDLEERVRELELAKTAQESAVRTIIGSTMSKLGSNINQYVTFGGAIEVTGAHTSDFSGHSSDTVQLSTAELDFDIKTSDWLLGNLIVSYDSGTSILFPTTNGFNAAVDRFTIDRATVTIGDVQRFPLYVKAGRDVLAFGTSTGVHRADVLSIENPLTTEVFETRRNEIGFGFALPTPPLGPPPRPYTAHPVRPMVVQPLVEEFASRLGYAPPPQAPKKPRTITPTPEPPPFYGELYFYDANVVEGVTRRFSNSLNGRLGYHAVGHCGRPYDELHAADLCPWGVDVSVDYLSSVFDSNFLANDYFSFIPQFGRIPGVGFTLKSNFGPILLIAEYETALKKANFVDDAARRISIAPATWQVALGYQLGWNPWLEAIGAQGTYVALGYSQSRDMAGVTLTTTGGPTRVGFVPQRRLLLTAGEWFLEGARLAFEYSHDWDYAVSKGGTGRQADGVFMEISYVW